MTNVIICGFSLYQIILLFFIYSFFGWCCEVIFATLKTGKFTNRGFLNGSVCPIYGVGVLIVLLSLSRFTSNFIILFLASILLTSILEFVTGFALEHFFKKKWWDYSEEPFNIKGYVCLRFSVLWGLACVFVLKIIQPPIQLLLNKVPPVVGYIFMGIFALVFVTDFVLTILQITKLNSRYKQIDILSKKIHSQSDKIGGALSLVTSTALTKIEELTSKIENSRLAKAFPKLNKKQPPNPDAEPQKKDPDVLPPE